MAEQWTVEEITRRVKQVTANQLQVDVESIRPENHYVDDLGADSLDLTELAIAFEDEFDLEIPDSDFNHLSTVSGVVEYLKGRLSISDH
ncbi:acyl carrier protein [Alicyclobacillus sp. TC]|uniref:Acyl carrier protein n=2 Tax=Alicyclobacillus tolerans TaxID=90970 RepID=A0A1M6MI82_9BACL|nr:MULTISPECIES: acyl carrier protein [Alicyclobacillus]MDP9728200.1 acyl carrier protein [Alicyclobacillus tengchongensis]QRF23422.1 acyl carrier protein [Alicyclobacillus sp. TC]SHJ83172.1 acyl carrier protein [Alicyclobacillus montanus]